MAQAQQAVLTGTGETIPWVNATAAVANMGDVQVLGNIIGVLVGSLSCVWPVAIGGAGELAIRGRFRFNKYSTNVFAKGTKCYWDVVNFAVTSVANSGANPLMGVVTTAVIAGDATCEVILNAGNLF